MFEKSEGARPTAELAVEYLRNAMVTLARLTGEIQGGNALEHRRTVVVAELESVSTKVKQALNFLLAEGQWIKRLFPAAAALALILGAAVTLGLLAQIRDARITVAANHERLCVLETIIAQELIQQGGPHAENGMAILRKAPTCADETMKRVEIKRVWRDSVQRRHTKQ